MKKSLLTMCALLIGVLAWAQPTTVPAPVGDDIVAIYGSQLGKPAGNGFNFYDWGSGSNGTAMSVDGKEAYMIPNLQWFGSQFDQVDASNKQKLHLDIYPMDNMDLAIALICWNSATNANWGERGVNTTLTGGEWNSIDINMQDLVDRGGQFEKLYQIKFVEKVVAEATDPYGSDGFQNGDGTKTFYVGNIYLTGTRIVDTEAPILVSAEATEVLGNQVTLTMKATDNNQKVSFVVTDAANNKTYDALGNAGEDVTLTIKGLNAETEYTWTVKAKDMAGNMSENTITVNFTTLEGFRLTAAPAVQHNTVLYDIFSIYCDEFEKSAPGAFFNTWGSAGEQLSEVSVVAGDNIEKIENFGYLGNEFTTTTDLRDYTVHMDVLATELTQIGLTPITQSGEASTLYNITPGQWTSLDIPMSDWTTLNAQYTFQFKWDRGNSQSDLYIDNFYFYKAKEVENVTISGNVTDEQGNAIVDATVTVTIVPATENPAPIRRAAADLTYTGTTDAQGNYSIDVPVVDGASYNIAISKDGYETFVQNDIDITEPILDAQLSPATITAVNDVDAAKAVASVSYVNVAGQVSHNAFDGVNIKVIRYTDGTTSTSKVMK